MAAAVKEFLRVAALRKGKLKTAEFYLRQGETGLSLFAHLDDPGPASILKAVQSAGKQGELAVVVLAGAFLRECGLVLRPIPGQTPDPAVNAIHWEARLPVWRRLLVRLSGQRPEAYFNDHLSRRLLESARFLEQGDVP